MTSLSRDIFTVAVSKLIFVSMARTRPKHNEVVKYRALIFIWHVYYSRQVMITHAADHTFS